MTLAEIIKFKTLFRITGYRLIKTPIGCWVLEGVKLSNYSTIKFHGRYITLHILSAILFLNHDIEKTKSRYVCHSCNIKACCNPKHIYIGTPSNNSKDIHIRRKNMIPDGQVINRNDYIKPHNSEFDLQFYPPKKEDESCH